MKGMAQACHHFSVWRGLERKIVFNELWKKRMDRIIFTSEIKRQFLK